MRDQSFGAPAFLGALDKSTSGPFPSIVTSPLPQPSTRTAGSTLLDGWMSMKVRGQCVSVHEKPRSGTPSTQKTDRAAQQPALGLNARLCHRMRRARRSVPFVSTAPPPFVTSGSNTGDHDDFDLRARLLIPRTGRAASSRHCAGPSLISPRRLCPRGSKSCHVPAATASWCAAVPTRPSPHGSSPGPSIIMAGAVK